GRQLSGQRDGVACALAAEAKRAERNDQGADQQPHLADRAIVGVAGNDLSHTGDGRLRKPLHGEVQRARLQLHRSAEQRRAIGRRAHARRPAPSVLAKGRGRSIAATSAQKIERGSKSRARFAIRIEGSDVSPYSSIFISLSFFSRQPVTDQPASSDVANTPAGPKY